jgi:multiple sugar transport system substrate-binding protein
MIPGGRLPSSKKIDVDKVAELMVGDAANLINVDSLKALIKGELHVPGSNDFHRFAGNDQNHQ